jgi:hypothetical protein
MIHQPHEIAERRFADENGNIVQWRMPMIVSPYRTTEIRVVPAIPALVLSADGRQ